MIHILLAILKIIGIILLVILGLILGIILIVLFVPIHYELRAGINEKTALDMLIRQAPGIDEEEKLDFITNLQIDVKITWILKLIRVMASFANKQLSYIVKLLFFTVLSSQPKEKKKSVKKEKSDSQKKEAVSEVIAEPVEKTEPIQQEPQPTLENATANEKESAQAPTPSKTADTKSEKKDFSKLIDDIKEKWNNISELVSNTDNQEFVKMVLLELKKLLWHIRPRKYNVFLYIGMEDPSVTGTIMMGYGIAKGVLGLEHFEIIPNFEKKIIRLSAYMSGRIRLIHIVVIACKVYFNKTFRKLLGRK